MKEEYNQIKVKFVKNKDDYNRIKQTNLSLKKLICQMISKNQDVYYFN